MILKVLYFGEIKSITQKSHQEFKLKPDATLGDLVAQINSEYTIKLKTMYSINLEYCSDMNTKLNPNDEIGIIPPVSGG